jgi:RNA polymerase II-associated factor 1
MSKEDPVSILRSTIKFFNIANAEDTYMNPDAQGQRRGALPTPAELEAWKAPKHPSKPNLKPLDFYPVLPDLDALGDTHSFVALKFAANVTDSPDKYDERVDVAMLRPLQVPAAVEEEFKAKHAAWEADPAGRLAPEMPLAYELFLPEDVKNVQAVKRKYDVDDPLKNDDSLYTSASVEDGANDSFTYQKLRIYETRAQTSSRDYPYHEIAIALHDPSAGASSSGRLQKAAYYYPVSAKQTLKQRRDKALKAMGIQTADDEEGQKLDQIFLSIGDPEDLQSQSKDSAGDAQDE